MVDFEVLGGGFVVNIFDTLASYPSSGYIGMHWTVDRKDFEACLSASSKAIKYVTTV